MLLKRGADHGWANALGQADGHDAADRSAGDDIEMVFDRLSDRPLDLFEDPNGKEATIPTSGQRQNAEPFGRLRARTFPDPDVALGHIKGSPPSAR